MKKLFLALSVLAVLTFGAVPSQALISMPDAVPGTNILVPFFLSKISGGETTLIVVQEVKGTATTLTVNVLTIDSVTKYDTSATLTKWDVEAFNIRDDWIVDMSDDAQKEMSIDLDGDTVNDHYAGYVTLDNTTNTDSNSLVSFIYQIDLDNGIAAGTLGVSVETEGNLDPGDTRPLVNSAFEELYNANALVRAKQLIAGADNVAPTFFAMYPRYFIYNSDSSNYIFSWRDTTGASANHVNWYDNAENPASSDFPLAHEVDIIDIADKLPNAHKTAYPYAGWIDVVTTSNFSAQWIMYSYQKAVGTPGTSWNALFEVHRDAGTS